MLDPREGLVVFNYAAKETDAWLALVEEFRRHPRPAESTTVAILSPEPAADVTPMCDRLLTEFPTLIVYVIAGQSLRRYRIVTETTELSPTLTALLADLRHLPDQMPADLVPKN